MLLPMALTKKFAPCIYNHSLHKSGGELSRYNSHATLAGAGLVGAGGVLGDHSTVASNRSSTQNLREREQAGLGSGG